MQIRFKILLTTNTQISSEWEVGAKRPTTHLIDRLNLSLHTKFQSIHPPPHPSNKASSLNLICISEQNLKWANPQPQSGQIPTRWAHAHTPGGQTPILVGKYPQWANAHISCGQMPILVGKCPRNIVNLYFKSFKVCFKDGHQKRTFACQVIGLSQVFNLIVSTGKNILHKTKGTRGPKQGNCVF